jgi:hypothetical protein
MCMLILKLLVYTRIESATGHAAVLACSSSTVAGYVARQRSSLHDIVTLGTSCMHDM